MVGQILNVSPVEARLLIAEGWAEPLTSIKPPLEPAARSLLSPTELS